LVVPETGLTWKKTRRVIAELLADFMRVNYSALKSHTDVFDGEMHDMNAELYALAAVGGVRPWYWTLLNTLPLREYNYAIGIYDADHAYKKWFNFEGICALKEAIRRGRQTVYAEPEYDINASYFVVTWNAWLHSQLGEPRAIGGLPAV
jgi:hypothetical protein